MFRRLRFFYLLSRSRFSEALAALGTQHWPRNGYEQWTAFRQGLFATVSNTSWDGKSIYGGMAVAISLAICGRHKEAELIVRTLNARRDAGKFRTRLARQIAPYARDLALGLLEHDKQSLGHRLVLLDLAGKGDEAKALLLTAIAEGKTQQESQLLLLASNLIDVTPEEKLSRFNAFLATHGLAPVRLKNPALPPGVSNLEAGVALPANDGPLVSVLMTAYNIGDRIGAALDGLLRQTWRNIEIIVVDDASTDDTGDVIQALAALDARIRYFRLPSNAGTYVAKTYGFNQARGAFVTCHDSDDWSHPQRIERQITPLLEDPNLVATTSRWVRIEDGGRYHVRLIYPLMQLNPASPMFRRDLVAKQAGLWDAARIGADSEFHSRLRLVFGRHAVKLVAQPLTLGAHRENSLMTARETGYSSEGLSPNRLAYWESWARWHIHTLGQGKKPVMPSITDPCRPFEAPETVRVPPERVLAAMQPPAGKLSA